MNKEFKKFYKVVAIIIIAGLLYFAGYLVGHRNIVLEKNYLPKIVNLDLGKSEDVDFSLFWQAWNVVKNKYLGNLDYKQMLYGSISGMISSLDDSYSYFLTPEDAKRFSEDLQGSFDGIGAELEYKDQRIVIVSPLPNSPAEKAGLLPEDIILKVDGQDCSEMSFEEAINKIRGEKESQVILTIYRQGWKESKDFTVTRDTIIVKSVNYEMKDEIAYIKVNQFGEDTLDLIKEALQFTDKNKAKGVIIDLRNNPGGYLTDAIDAGSLFLDDGKIVVQEEDKNGSKEQFKTTIKKICDINLVVLVNKGSASSSEIFAGAIKDNKRGVIIGEKTFGKGSVQTLEELTDGSKVRITIAKWLTPSGTNIDKNGIEPDIIISLSEEDKKSGKDPQMERALEELSK